MSVDDRDFAYWFDYFKRHKPSLAEFFVAIETKDLYYLNNPTMASFDDVLYEDLYDGGFIEGDFRKILNAHEESDTSYYQARIAIVLFKGVDLKHVKNKLNTKENPKVFEDVIEKVCEGISYIQCGIQFHTLMKALFNSKSVENMNAMLEWGFMHGVKLAEEYGENFQENPDFIKLESDFNQQVDNMRKNGINEPENPKRLGITNDVDDFYEEDEIDDE